MSQATKASNVAMTSQQVKDNKYQTAAPVSSTKLTESELSAKTDRVADTNSTSSTQKAVQSSGNQSVKDDYNASYQAEKQQYDQKQSVVASSKVNTINASNVTNTTDQGNVSNGSTTNATNIVSTNKQTQKTSKFQNLEWIDGNTEWKNSDGSITKDKYQEINGKTYYFDADGKKVTGWANNIDGNGQTQYFGTDGAQYKNGYYTIQGDTYYFDAEGNLVKGWQDHLPGATAPHYFDQNTGVQAKNGYYVIDNKECYFDKDGNYVPNAPDPYKTGAVTGEAKVPVTIKNLDNVSKSAIRGMDISSYDALEQAGVKFYGDNGYQLPLMKILADHGINYIRLRIWNDPSKQVSWGWGGGDCDEAHELAIAKEAAQYGINVMIDFHYSDWWSDPGTQAIPAAWKGENHQQLCDSMTKWTEKVLTDFKNAGAHVGMVQIGNEITNGFMDVFKSRNDGGTYKDVWDNAQDAQKLCDYLNAGAKGVRTVDPNALIAVHIETPKADKYEDIMNVLQAHNVDYDVLGSSFYPYWQGLDKQSDFNDLKQCEQLAKEHGKYFAVLETAWPFTLEDSDGCKNNIGPSDTNISKLYPISPQGQADELEDVYSTVMSNDNGLGAFYWEPAWIAVKAGTDNWNNYNSPANKKYGTESGWDNQALFDDHGNPLGSLDVYNKMCGENDQTYAKIEYVDDDTGKMTFGGFHQVLTGNDLMFDSPDGTKITKIDTKKAQTIDIVDDDRPDEDPKAFDINKANEWQLCTTLPGAETFVVHYTKNMNAKTDTTQTQNAGSSNSKTSSNGQSMSGSSSSTDKPSDSSQNKPGNTTSSTPVKPSGSESSGSGATTSGQSGSSTTKPSNSTTSGSGNKPSSSQNKPGNTTSSTSNKPSGSSSSGSTTTPDKQPAGQNPSTSGNGSVNTKPTTSNGNSQGKPSGSTSTTPSTPVKPSGSESSGSGANKPVQSDKPSSETDKPVTPNKPSSSTSDGSPADNPASTTPATPTKPSGSESSGSGETKPSQGSSTTKPSSSSSDDKQPTTPSSSASGAQTSTNGSSDNKPSDSATPSTSTKPSGSTSSESGANKPAQGGSSTSDKPSSSTTSGSTTKPTQGNNQSPQGGTTAKPSQGQSSGSSTKPLTNGGTKPNTGSSSQGNPEPSRPTTPSKPADSSQGKPSDTTPTTPVKPSGSESSESGTNKPAQSGSSTTKPSGSATSGSGNKPSDSQSKPGNTTPTTPTKPSGSTASGSGTNKPAQGSSTTKPSSSTNVNHYTINYVDNNEIVKTFTEDPSQPLTDDQIKMLINSEVPAGYTIGAITTSTKNGNKTISVVAQKNATTTIQGETSPVSGDSSTNNPSAGNSDESKPAQRPDGNSANNPADVNGNSNEPAEPGNPGEIGKEPVDGNRPANDNKSSDQSAQTMSSTTKSPNKPQVANNVDSTSDVSDDRVKPLTVETGKSAATSDASTASASENTMGAASDANTISHTSDTNEGDNTQGQTERTNVLSQTGDHVDNAGLAITLGAIAAASALAVDKRNKKD